MSKALEAARELVKMLEENERADKVQLSTLNPGETFKIGEHDFIVLEQKQEQTMVISKGFMAENEKFDDDTRDYNESSLKKLIDRYIQPIIENEVGADNLVEHDVDLTSVDMQKEFGTCRCKVRPITFDEARNYNDLLVTKTWMIGGGRVHRGARKSVGANIQSPLFLRPAVSAATAVTTATVFAHSVSYRQ